LRDAVTLGNWIRDQGLVPDLVVCSAATRARQTWDLAGDQLAGVDEDSAAVLYDPRLYEAAPGDLADIIREAPPEVVILALVGHNPAAAELVRLLTGDTAMTGGSGPGFPTSALAVIGVRDGWDRVGPGSGSLDGYWTPKGGSLAPPG
jgi:phosphohistidine phosphatase